MMSMRKCGKVLSGLMLGLIPFTFAACSSQPNLQAQVSTTSTRITAAIDDQPIKASIATLTVHGMGCPQCSSNVDKQLLAVPGVRQVEVNLGTGEVSVHLAPTGQPTGNQLAAAIKKSGYTLIRIESVALLPPHDGHSHTATTEK